MLVFLPGERWIRDAEHALKRFGPKGYELLPLYARLTTARQRKILEPGKRRASCSRRTSPRRR